MNFMKLIKQMQQMDACDWWEAMSEGAIMHDQVSGMCR